MSWEDHLDAVLATAHARLSRDPAARSFRVTLPEPAQRDALADLLGSAARPGEVVRVQLDGPRGLAAAVEQASGLTLRDYLTARFGPFLDPTEAKRVAAGQRAELWGWWLGHPYLRQRPELDEWADGVVRLGTRGGTSATRALLEQVLTVLAELPVADELLPMLAGRLVNDTHALDAGTALGSHVVAAIAAAQGVDRPVDAAGRRALWRSVGVRDDELSSTVLVAGLRPSGDSTTARLCRLAADAGEAVSLTLAQVRQGVEAWNADRVFVVENPAVVALAVREFGRRAPPLLCGAGWPSAAVTELIAQLRAAGADACYHGDLDGEGLRIAAHLIDLCGVIPWRMSTADYLSAVAGHGAGVGRVTAALWDAELAPALADRGVAVLEETVWPRLRDDLAHHLNEAAHPPTDCHLL
ncbi:MAG: TIGR02679 family protein [Micropruina sp.]|uniref:TIGR02679 family protein n=1 Tax=Micropruina sp. TaxID=2737536 RepID=UPI0039E49E31